MATTRTPTTSPHSSAASSSHWAPGGSREYRRRIIDLPTDEPIDEPPVLADPNAVLIAEPVIERI